MAVQPMQIREGSPQHWVLRGLGTVLVVGGLLLVATKASDGFISDVTQALILAVAAMSLNLVLGYTGMISIGHSAFFGIGAYTSAICVSRYHWNPWLTFVAGFVVAFVIGMVVSLPALRIKGIYLALVTLSLALVFPAFIKWKRLEWFTGGTAGLQKTTFNPKMRRFEILGHDFFGNLRSVGGKTVFYYWIAVVLAVVGYVICRGIVKSRVGRSLVAIRDNETAAAVMGVPLARTRALVFGVSAGVCSLGGAWTALFLGNIRPADTGVMALEGAITFLIIMVIGGAGHLWGPIVGAFAYVMVSSSMSDWDNDSKIPGLLRPFLAWSKVPPATGVFAVALVVLMFVAPFGLVGLWNRMARRLVAIVPTPAGSAAPTVAEELPGPFEPTDTTTPEGDE